MNKEDLNRLMKNTADLRHRIEGFHDILLMSEEFKLLWHISYVLYTYEHKDCLSVLNRDYLNKLKDFKNNLHIELGTDAIIICSIYESIISSLEEVVISLENITVGML